MIRVKDLDETLAFYTDFLGLREVRRGTIGDEATLVFLADLIPTAAHLPLPWIMGYDVEPLRTLESRRSILGDAVAGGWLLLFEHDARVAYGRAVEAKGGAALADEVLAPGAASA